MKAASDTLGVANGNISNKKLSCARYDPSGLRPLGSFLLTLPRWTKDAVPSALGACGAAQTSLRQIPDNHRFLPHSPGIG